MIIMKQLEKRAERTIDQLLPGDILKRKSDGCFYKLETISEDNVLNEKLFIFYGFAVKFARNLRFHFEMEDGLFFVY